MGEGRASPALFWGLQRFSKLCQPFSVLAERPTVKAEVQKLSLFDDLEQTGCLKFLDVVRESRRADVVQLKQSIAGAGLFPRSNLFQYIDTPRLGQRSRNPLKLPFRHHSLLSLACHCSTLRAPNGPSPSKVASARSDIQALGIAASVVIQTRFGSMIRRFADSGEEWVRALRRRDQTVSSGSELNRCGTRRAGNSHETTTRLRCLRFEQLHHPGAMPVHTNGIPHGVG